MSLQPAIDLTQLAERVLSALDDQVERLTTSLLVQEQLREESKGSARMHPCSSTSLEPDAVTDDGSKTPNGTAMGSSNVPNGHAADHTLLQTPVAKPQQPGQQGKPGSSTDDLAELTRTWDKVTLSAVYAKKMKMADFETVAVIGRGAFGEVRLVTKKGGGDTPYAMKVMKKSEMIKKNQVDHIRAERDLLALADNPWVVRLVYSFQDAENLYLIMEYLAGGDFMGMLIKYDVFDDRDARFYVAELASAVHSVHKLGFIHRDLKPDNILLQANGHIKLTDFGLCKGLDRQRLDRIRDTPAKVTPAKSRPPQPTHQASLSVLTTPVQASNDKTTVTPSPMRTHRARALAHSTVGTPDYIAPEVFEDKGYGAECDWWSVGIIMYEALVGWPPFAADSPVETMQNILSWRRCLQFPADRPVSAPARDLLSHLLCDAKDRWGFAQIKEHEWFAGLDWDALHGMKAPVVPTVEHPKDIRNFDEFHPDESDNAQEQKLSGRMAQRAQDSFVGYTFKRDDSAKKQLHKLKDDMFAPLEEDENEDDDDL